MKGNRGRAVGGAETIGRVASRAPGSQELRNVWRHEAQLLDGVPARRAFGRTRDPAYLQSSDLLSGSRFGDDRSLILASVALRPRQPNDVVANEGGGDLPEPAAEGGLGVCRRNLVERPPP